MTLKKTSRLYLYSQKANTHDLLKTLAILLMIIDHIGNYFYPDCIWLRLIGRGAAPIFYFLIGFSGKLNCRLSLFVYGGILSVSSAVFFHQIFWINILYTFVFANMIIQYFPAKTTPHSIKVGIFVFLAIAHLLMFRYVEYGTLGILIALTANWHIHKVPYSAIWLAMSLSTHFLWQALAFGFVQDENLAFAMVAMCAAFWILFNIYQLKDIRSPKLPRLIILVLSRYSLEIYFYHLMLFQIITINSALII